jgi:virulence factor
MKKGKGLRFGVVGLGVMGSHHVRIISSLPGAKLAAVADVDFSKTEETGKRLGTKAFVDYHKLLPEVEAVCLATPTQTHFQIAQEVIAAGKHLLIEKPFTGSSTAASQLVSLAQEKRVLLAVNLIERYNPALLKLLRLLKGKKVHGVDIKRFSPFPERITDTNVIFDMMIHDLALVSLIVPDEIEAIKAEGKKIRSNFLDRVVVTITHKSGTITRLAANRVFSVKTRKIAVTTEKNILEADLLNKLIYVRDFSAPIPSTLPVKPCDQLTEILKGFVTAIKGKPAGQQLLPPLPSGKEGLKALVLAERIEKACL